MVCNICLEGANVRFLPLSLKETVGESVG